MKKVDIDIQTLGEIPVKASFNLPEKWDEVPEKLYLFLAAIYLADAVEMNKFDKTVQAFRLLSIEHRTVIENLDAEELYDLLPLVDWVFDKLDLRKNLIPVITIDKKKYLGPADELENLRFAEWCAADTFFMNYTVSGDIYQLQQLAAVLYRPAGTGDEYSPEHVTWRGDRREKFNDQLLKNRTALMAQLPKAVLQGIFLFYTSARAIILEGYPEVFSGNSKSREDTRQGWLDIYDDLRADPKYAGPDRLDEEMMHSVFFSLERNNIKMAKIKEQYDI